MSQEILLKCIAVAAVSSLSFTLFAQEGGWAPGRLDIGTATGAGDVKLTEEGQVLPGDLSNSLPDSLGRPAKDPDDPSLQMLDQLPDSVANLKPAQRIEITRLLREAATYIQGIRLQEGLDRLIQIEAITPDLFQTYNLRGAIHTKLRDFDKARAEFKKALSLQPGLMEAQFNLAELDFVEKKFARSESAFRQLKTDNPELRLETLKLIDYKLYISLLMQSQSKGDAKHRAAMAMLDSFDYLDDFPLHYYGKAVKAFQEDDKEEAEEWMASARRIYDKPTQTIYIDALIEMGWVDSL
ncbi:MAG: tetratricopeptide repeat protein [Verrucomicrobiaceae bacterium]|nr:tetratricopeptide repeat protein [Verrucomicrobiaceae bacterium]